VRLFRSSFRDWYATSAILGYRQSEIDAVLAEEDSGDVTARFLVK
jgi:hypothetical protein